MTVFSNSRIAIVSLFFIFLFWLLYGCTVIQAQPMVKFGHITTEDGLSNNYINTIFQDADGFMWFGTFAGLDRYDGYNFKIYYNVAHDSKSLSHSSVYSIYEDHKGILWVGTERGLNRFDKETNTFISYKPEPQNPSGLSNGNIRRIYEDKKGDFWLATYGGGLDRFDPETGKFKRYVHISGDIYSLRSNLVNTIFVDKEDRFWVGTEGWGLSLFDPTTGRFTNFHSQYSKVKVPKNDIVTRIIEDENGNIWFGTWYEGFFEYLPGKGSFRNFGSQASKHGNLPENTVLSLLMDRSGFLWVGTFGGGLEKFNPENGSHVWFKYDPDNPNSLSHDAVWSLYQDRAGIIWIGTFGGGINKFNPNSNRFSLYKASRIYPNSLDNSSVTSISEDHSGILWIGTSGGGLNLLDLKKQKFRYFLNEPNSAKSVIRAIHEDDHARMWVSTDDGIYCFDKSRNHIVHFSKNENREGFGNYFNYSICEDQNENLWFGTWNEGLKCLKLKDLDLAHPDHLKLVTYLHRPKNPDSLPDNLVWDIIQDRDGKLWLATGSGVVLFNPLKQKFTPFFTNNETHKIEKYNTGCLFEDRSGNIWFGTFGYGFGKIDREDTSYNLFNPDNGHNVAEVLGIEQDDKGNLWMSTSKGIVKYNPSLDRLWNYDVTDGLQGDLYHLGAHAKLKNGNLAFGGIHGLNIFNPDSIFDNPYVPPVYITDVKVYNKSIFKKPGDRNSLYGHSAYRIREVEIPYNQKTITIEYTALSYSSPEKNQYKYQLDGFDKNWITTSGKNRTVTYTNLKGGYYTFRVIAGNNDGIWNDTGATLRIHIIPPYWEQWWFRLIIILIIVAAIFLLFRIRLGQVHKQLEDINLSKEKELVKLRNEKLNSELDFKTRELAQSTMHVIRKNEEIIEIRDMLDEIVPFSSTEGKQRLKKLLRSIDQMLDNKATWDYFEYNFNLVHNNFLKRFAEKYPDINHNDLKICAYIRMNLSTKEIANLLNISYRTIESTRYRIRKKINLETDKTLNDYIMRF